jgi:hypothetical protein
MKTRLVVLQLCGIAAVFTLGIVALVWNPVRLVARTQASDNGGAPQSSAAQQPGEAKGKTAGDVYMDVQILKDIPGDQLMPAMRYIKVALGVGCDHCHDEKDFASDDKPAKAQARNMMKMMFAINAENFDGRRAITCYTCHHGAAEAAKIPALPETTQAATVAPTSWAMAAPGEKRGPESIGGPSVAVASQPTVDAILDKYAQALGGTDAVEKVTTRVEKGTVDTPQRRMHATLEVYRKAPDKALAILHSPMGDVVAGFNGAIGWESRASRGVWNETGDELSRLIESASFFAGLRLKQDYSRTQALGVEKVGNRDTYSVAAWRRGGGQVRFFFDTETGLLLRMTERIESPLGDLPQETDYDDYRIVSGVKMPFTIQVVRMDRTITYKWDQVQTNVPMDDSQFAKPPEKPSKPEPVQH